MTGDAPRFRIVWPDGDHYEEDGETEFTASKARSILRSLAGTIAGITARAERVE